MLSPATALKMPTARTSGSRRSPCHEPLHSLGPGGDPRDERIQQEDDRGPDQSPAQGIVVADPGSLSRPPESQGSGYSPAPPRVPPTEQSDRLPPPPPPPPPHNPLP